MAEPVELAMRAASLAHVDELARICRRGSPESLRWNSLPSISRGWWQSVIRSEAAETWVAYVDEQAVGVCVLILDESQWEKQSSERTGAAFVRFLAVLLCPRVAVASLLRKARARLRQPPHHVIQKLDPIPASERVWNELVTVDPHWQGQGIGSELLAQMDRRALHNGRRGIRARTDHWNTAVHRMNERGGYVKAHLGKSALFWQRSLSERGD